VTALPSVVTCAGCRKRRPVFPFRYISLVWCLTVSRLVGRVGFSITGLLLDDGETGSNASAFALTGLATFRVVGNPEVTRDWLSKLTE
jgi:hypothetical protein